MTFDDFLGNARIAAALRRMLTGERLPQALLFAGPRGVGKLTLATLLARAANCERGLGEICGRCATCQSLAALDDVEELARIGRQERGSANPEDVPLILRPHSSVTVLVPDTDYIRVSQMHFVVREAYGAPTAGRRNFFLFDQAERLRHDFADTLLKVLEEPPPKTTLILVTDSPFSLRPTVRSRCVSLWFAPLSHEEVTAGLQKHRPEWKKGERELAAAAGAGSLGAALGLDLDLYQELRGHALALARAALADDFSPMQLFEASSTLAGKAARFEEDEPALEGRKGFEISLDILYSLLTDIVYLKVGVPDVGLRHPDLLGELRSLGERASWARLARAVGGLDEIWSRQRRNLNRQLALEAWAFGAEQLSANA
ncbi:MAG: ATP-binding protein [Candidatus Acidiferrales bacterium]